MIDNRLVEIECLVISDSAHGKRIILPWEITEVNILDDVDYSRFRYKFEGKWYDVYKTEKVLYDIVEKKIYDYPKLIIRDKIDCKLGKKYYVGERMNLQGAVVVDISIGKMESSEIKSVYLMRGDIEYYQKHDMIVENLIPDGYDGMVQVCHYRPKLTFDNGYVTEFPSIHVYSVEN